MKYLLIFMILALSRQSKGQLPDYYVYTISGNATVSKTGTKPVVIKQTQLVYKRDAIVLEKGAEITLVDRDGNFLVLNTAGIYEGSELITKAEKRNNEGITSKYLTLLFHELLDPNIDYEKFKKENIAGVRAGVTRDNGCGNRLFPVKGLKSSATSIIFRWRKTSPSSDYWLVIYDGNAKELFKTNAKDTLQIVSISETLGEQPGKYFWRVTSKDGMCEDEIPIYFEIMTAENEKKEAQQLIGNAETESLETELQKIDKLEQNAFIYAASDRYATLIKAHPDNSALLKSYVSFLLKYGFDNEAAAAWK